MTSRIPGFLLKYSAKSSGEWEQNINIGNVLMKDSMTEEISRMDSKKSSVPIGNPPSRIGSCIARSSHSSTARLEKEKISKERKTKEGGE